MIQISITTLFVRSFLPMQPDGWSAIPSRHPGGGKWRDSFVHTASRLCATTQPNKYQQMCSCIALVLQFSPFQSERPHSALPLHWLPGFQLEETRNSLHARRCCQHGNDGSITMVDLSTCCDQHFGKSMLISKGGVWVMGCLGAETLCGTDSTCKT